MNKKHLLAWLLCMALVALCALSVAAEDRVIYLAANGRGNGASADAPIGSLSSAFKALDGDGGRILVLGEYTVGNRVIWPEVNGDIIISGEAGGSLRIETDFGISKNTNANTYTFDLPVYVSVDSVDMYARFNSVTFGENFVTTGGTFNYYGGVNANSAADNAAVITTLPYTITVNGGTFGAFHGGNLRKDLSQKDMHKAVSLDMVGSIAAPITVNINGGTFGKAGSYPLTSNNKSYDTFSVSGYSILADDATLNITGGTFNTPVYVQGQLKNVPVNSSTNSKLTASQREYYAIDGDIAVNISGGTFNGGAVSAYYVQAAYTQVMRGNYDVTVTGGHFADGTVFDATQVKAYAGSDKKATIRYDAKAYNFEVIRFDSVNGEAQIYEEPLRIAFIGDSITEGYAPESSAVNRLTQSYPANFLALAEADGREVIVSNFGISAAGLLPATTRYYPDMLAYPIVTEECAADYYFLALGTNDNSVGGTNGALELYRKNLTDLVELLGGLPDTEKVFMTNAIYRYSATDSSPNSLRISAVIHPIQEAVARAFAAEDPDKYVFVDFYGLTLPEVGRGTVATGSLLSSDCLHPGAKGYAAMGRVLYHAAFNGVTECPETYKSTDVWVSQKGAYVAAGTQDDPCGKLYSAYDKFPLGGDVTLHIVGEVTYNANIYFPIGLNSLTVVGEGDDAKLIVKGDSFKIGSNTKFDNLTIKRDGTGDAHIMCCYNSVEFTESVVFEGNWSFYAGYNVFSDVDPASSATFDTVDSASSDKDCTLILNCTADFEHFTLGNRRFAGDAKIGTYSGDMNVTIGSRINIIGDASRVYIGIIGHNYVTGSITVTNFTRNEIPMSARSASLSGVTHDPSLNTGTVTQIMALVGSGDVNGDGEVTVVDVLLALRGLLNGSMTDSADLDGDGKVTFLDVLRILKKAAD